MDWKTIKMGLEQSKDYKGLVLLELGRQISILNETLKKFDNYKDYK